MFQSPAFDRLRQTFADQFQTDGDRVIFRKNLKAAPVEVTAQERERLIAGFNRTLGRLYVGLLIATFLAMIGVAGMAVALHRGLGPFDLYIALAFIMVAFMAIWRRAWNAPARLIAGRPALGPPLTREATRRLGLARISWNQIGAVAASVALPLWRVDWSRDLWRGWNLMWLALAAGLIVVCAVQAFRKWREQSRAG